MIADKCTGLAGISKSLIMSMSTLIKDNTRFLIDIQGDWNEQFFLLVE